MLDAQMSSRAMPLTSVFGERDNATSSAKRRAAALPTAAELFVHSLPGLPNLASHPTHPLEIYAGLLPSYSGEGDIGKEDKLYFLMTKARRSAGPQRVIFWFNGGPGCSSFDGSLMEVGPFRTVPATSTTSGKVEVKLVEGGWEEFATVVFVDQPPGTGYSFAPTDGYLHDFDQLSSHFIQFLQNFYRVFPELDGVDTYLAGESFAGQYIPNFASSILSTPFLPNFSLKGIAIGNGWIDPIEQYPGYVDFAYEKDLIKQGSVEGERMEAALKRCQEEMGKYTDPFKTPVNINYCGEVMESVSEPYIQELNGKKVCMNVYDVRLVDDWPACGMNWPPDLEDVYTFLREPDTVRALHATANSAAWVECNNKVSHELSLRNSHASAALLPGILEKGVPILMFAGDEDLICNYKGIERIVNGLTWNGETGIGNATSQKWYLNDTLVGTWQSSRNLSYARIYASSHMVGFDKPHVTNDMIMRFMGVDLSLLAGETATWNSKVGDDERIGIHIEEEESEGLPLIKGGKTDWEAWYNATSAILVLLILVSIVGLYFYFRRKPPYRHYKAEPGNHFRNQTRDAEEGDLMERMPLGAERIEMDDIERAEGYEFPSGDEEARRRDKGWKGKARDGREREVVFKLVDEDDDDRR
nr:pheromone-processing carboxypeptidase KEX1 [Cryptococcus depauperatus CBS 7841]